MRLILVSALVLSSFSAVAAPFTVTSPDFAAGKTIPQKFAFNGFGCTGENVSPALSWKNAPKGTKSFAIMVHDPDAPTGGAGFWHWVVIDLPSTLTGVAEGDGKLDSASLPKGAQQIRTDFGVAAWGGPCPPVGDKPHHYDFTVYALKTDKLDVPAGATASLVGFLINSQTIAKARVVGRYGR